MLQYFIVIALALQVCVLAENNETEISFMNLKCTTGTLEEANMLVLQKSLYDKYVEKFDVFVQKKDSDSFVNLKDAFTILASKINGSCANGSLDYIPNPPFFLQLVEYAVKDAQYSEFIKSGGNLCVSTVKKYLSACVSNSTDFTKVPADVAHRNASGHANSTTPTNTTGSPGNLDNGAKGDDGTITTDQATNIIKKHQLLFQELLKMTYLHFNESNCDLKEEIRHCVNTVMQDDKYTATCKPEHSKYVDSLFNFTMTKCPSSPKEEKSAQKAGANSFLFNPVVILLEQCC